jgi:hypothetical protein
VKIFLKNTANVIKQVKYPNDSLLNPSFTLRRQDDEGFKAFSFTGELEFEGEDYNFIYADLWTSPSALTNEVEIKFVDECCTTPKEYVFTIRAESVEWCENKCVITAAAVEKSIESDVIKCLRNTLIWDNTATNTPSGIPFKNKQHPRFTYCNEIRPHWQHDFMMIAAIIFASGANVLTPIVQATNFLINKVNAVITKLNTLLIIGQEIPLIDFDNNPSTSFLQEFTNKKNEILSTIVGCGRKHPSPLVRSYAENVCGKCGVIFQSSIFNNPASDYHNTCYHNAPVDKGVNFNDTTNFWIDNNKPLLTGVQFFDQLKELFNCEWRVDGNILFFERKDFFQNKTPFIDTTILTQYEYELCYGWSKKDRPSYAVFDYAKDAVNTVGSEANRRYGDIVEWNSPPLPGQKGALKPNIQFAACRFRDDRVRMINGKERDVISTYKNAPYIGQLLQQFNNVVILNQHICYTPMLLIWDGVSVTDAKVSPTKFGQHTNNPKADPGEYYNYPLWFDENFNDNMYERFWKVENPRLSGFQKKTYTLTVELKCSYLSVLDLDGKIKTMQGDGKVDEIVINYESKKITIKGQI